MSRRDGRGVPFLAAAGYLLLVVAWAMANPAGAAPDEDDHYMRALAVGRGDLRGRPNPQLADERFRARLPKSTTAPAVLSSVWGSRGARLVSIPGGLGPHAGFGCSRFDPNKTASCLDDHRADPAPSDRLTTMGTVEPAAYILPGLATRLARDPVTALRLARLASGVVVVALLSTAVMVLWSWSAAALAGLLVALTPSVVFIGSMLSPSAFELAGAVCFFAALLRLTMGPPASRGTWVALGVAGVVLASSRSLGPVWIVLALAVVVICEGWRPTWGRLRSGGRWAAAAIAGTAAAMASTVWWEAAFQPGIDFDAQFFRDQLIPSMSQLGRVGHELIGVFGWLDTGMPTLAYAAWTTMVVATATLALLVGSWRQRIVLVLLAPGVVLATLVVSAALMRQNGFDVQGRHVLPMATLIPLFAAAVLAQNGARLLDLWPRRLLLWFAVPVAAVQAVAFYVNARRYAVGISGPLNFLGSAEWHPPGGWAMWLIVVAAGVVSIVAAAVVAGSDPPPPLSGAPPAAGVDP